MMLAPTNKRKRARKACVPCHQRKRKCDAGFPCNMCTTYGYSCKYTDEAKRVSTGVIRATASGFATSNISSRAHISRESHESGRLSQSPAIVAGPSATATPSAIANGNNSKEAGSPAAMAFPHILGKALGSKSPPQVHSFAYTFGIRPEEAPHTHDLLGQFISEEDLGLYSQMYFSALAPIGDFLDPKIYAKRCQDYYHGSGNTAIAFGAVAAGIAALGSFLSRNRHPRESDLVQYAKAILDDPASIRLLSVDHIIAWGLRTFYLRATTRPTTAWIASCTAMHLCEALGLHDERRIQKIASTNPKEMGHDEDRLRRIFWISWAGHNMLSYEYARSPVHFQALTCHPILPTDGSLAHQFIAIVQIIPTSNSLFQLEHQPPSLRDELLERLKVLDQLDIADPFLVLTKADLAFCFYRRLYELKSGISDEVTGLVINSGNAAVRAAEQLANQGRLFWNVIGSVFQYACVLLAIDSPTASPHIPTTFQCLQDLVKAADTALTREALSIAKHLLRLSTARKRKELAQLEPYEASNETVPSQPESENVPLPDLNWDIDWDQFLLEPYLSMFDRDLALWQS